MERADLVPGEIQVVQFLHIVQHKRREKMSLYKLFKIIFSSIEEKERGEPSPP
jgi:hypothetical protein